MIGPRPLDFWTPPTDSPYGHLQPGRHYRVIQPFVDFDGDPHPTGETWLYLGHNFLPHDDGLSLFISLNGEESWHVRMQLIEEEQGTIVESFEDYVTEHEPVPA